jgi:hypothetical protein
VRLHPENSNCQVQAGDPARPRNRCYVRQSQESLLFGAIHLQDLYSQRMTAGLSARTVLHLHRVLHAALADAERWDLVDANVASKAPPPTGPGGPRRS